MMPNNYDQYYPNKVTFVGFLGIERIYTLVYSIIIDSKTDFTYDIATVFEKNVIYRILTIF